jgi:hypothetical protein
VNLPAVYVNAKENRSTTTTITGARLRSRLKVHLESPATRRNIPTRVNRPDELEEAVAGPPDSGPHDDFV